MDKYKIDDVVAGIVTYNPNMERLEQCINAALGQIRHLVIFDNGSINISNIKELVVKSSEDTIVIENGKNDGIATALSRIMLFAKANNYKWVLTLDQDSILQEGIVRCYLETANSSEYVNAGMITCLIKDRNFYDEKYEKQKAQVISVPYCITSGAFTSVNRYLMTSGYDENFFIDCVDFDICYSLIENGYQIYRVNRIGILHEVGHGEEKRFLWKKIIVYHEKPERIYYLARNTKWLEKKHKSYGKVRMIYKEMALLCRILLYEDNKNSKLKAFIKGVFNS